MDETREYLRHWMTFAARQSVTWSLIGQYPVGVILGPTILYDIGRHRLGLLYYYTGVRLQKGQRDMAFEVSDIQRPIQGKEHAD